MKKKIFMAAAFLFAGFMANAQENSESVSYKPQPKRLTVEVGFCPFQSNSTTLENGRLNGSYSFNDKWAIRAGLGWGMNSVEDADKNETTTTLFSFVPGVTYSFKGTERMTLYVGGEIILAGGGEEYKPNKGEKKDSSFGTFGFQAFTGMNYYFAKNLYVGVEFGFGIRSTKSEDKNERETTTTDFAPYAQPSVRLGWTF